MVNFYFQHGESTSTASQLTSPVRQKSKDLKKVLLLFTDIENPLFCKPTVRLHKRHCFPSVTIVSIRWSDQNVLLISSDKNVPWFFPLSLRTWSSKIHQEPQSHTWTFKFGHCYYQMISLSLHHKNPVQNTCVTHHCIPS